MDIISRAEWGARRPRSRSTVTWGQRTEFIVHYSEGPTTQSVRSIQDFHMGTRGWSDIGYNFLVDVHGRIYEGRGWLTVGAHAPGHNTSGIGVCMIGRDGDATPAAERAIRWLYDEACRRAGRRLAKLGHRDVYQTSCPGDQLYAWVRAGMPAPDGPTTQEDPLLGLKKGDKGERVQALQLMIEAAGVALPTYGADSHYGNETAEGLRKVRASVGSKATEGYGDRVDARAYQQLHAAVARNQGKLALKE
ncbi:N-acetylmuramoyl-L-alanine amidase [Actinomadura formosensis]|uniref:N-acetylmuramoyl-L-alanine amidase n=1 Tax=Actinomadura formosensis TaxID=60706 RepID=UPI003D904D67